MVKTSKTQPRKTNKKPNLDNLSNALYSDPIQEDLVEVFPGIFVTPDTPADPRDCNRYPNSIYCNPQEAVSFEPVNLDFDIVRDECNIGIQLSPTLFFVSLPTFQIVQRLCPPKEPEPKPKNESSQARRPPNIRWNPTVKAPFAGHLKRYFYRETVDYYDGRTWEQEINFSSEMYQEGKGIFTLRLNTYYDIYSRGFPPFNYHTEDVDEDFQKEETYVYRSRVSSDLTNRTGWFLEKEGELFYQRPMMGSQDSGIRATHFVSEDKIPGIDNDAFAYNVIRSRTDVSPNGTVRTEKEIFEYEYFQIDYPLGKVFPPPPPKPKDKKMCNCSNIDAKLNKIMRLIGNYPANVPARLTGDDTNTVSINSIAENIKWLTLQLDSVLGEYPIKIDIEDTDITQSGNQSQSVVLPNMSEVLAEIVGINLAIKTEVAAILKSSINTLIEAGAIHQGVAYNGDYLEAIAEWCAFKQKHVSKKIALGMSPNESYIDKVLEPKEIDYRTVENDDNNDFKDMMQPLLHMAAMYQAQNFRNLGTSDPKSKLRELLEAGVDLAPSVAQAIKVLRNNGNNNENEEEENTSKSDLDRFFEDAELGFSNVEGSVDPASTNPWGRRYGDRPRIQQLGKTNQGDSVNNGAA